MSETVIGELPSKEDFNFQKIVLIVGVSLMLMKFVAWAITQSVSIFTDALESIVNVVAACIGLYALYLSAKPRDAAHPFGHGRVEIISSTIEGGMICSAGAIIIFEAINRIISPTGVEQLDVGLILVAVAAIVNYATGRVAIRKGKKNRSAALVASGKHLCSDTYSSIGIIVGLLLMIGLENLGYQAYWLDGTIAALFGVIITITGAKVIKESMDTVMDKADNEIVNNVVDTLKEHRHEDWIDIHNLRIIKNGTTLNIQMHVVLPRDMTIERQSNEISEVLHSVKEIYGEAVDLTLMGDPCDGNFCSCCKRECGCREHQFVRIRDWTVESICNADSVVSENAHKSA
jgi:cation diffusion facilitator family transporter